MSIVLNVPASQVSQPLAQYLLDLGAPVTLIARTPDKLRPLVEQGARLVEGSFEDPAVLAHALKGAQALFWLTPPAFRPDATDWAVSMAARAAKLAAEQGVKRAVVLSSIGAQSGRVTGPVSCLLEVEQAFQQALPDVTALRPGYFFENLLRDIPLLAKDGVLASPVPGDKRQPWVSTRDIGQRAAQVLLDNTWKGHRVLGIHGPADVTWKELAATLGRELGRPVRYVELTIEQFRERSTQAGLPAFAVDMYAQFFQSIRDGKMDPAEPRESWSTGGMTFAEFTRTVLGPRVAAARHGGKLFMAALTTRPEVKPEDVAPHAAAEHSRFMQMIHEGLIVQGNLAVGRRRGWLVVRAQDTAGAEAAIRTLPLSRFWNIGLHEVES